MRIAFITGSLEPGRDGVGDYTQTLAAECARLGHAVCLLSLGETQRVAAAPTGGAPLLRLTPAEWRADGGAAARRWLDDFAPDWASLQFVPYSFDPRGFFHASIAPLAQVLGGAPRRHIFFHETWIGSQVGATGKARVFGWWQRRAVATMLRRLAPARVHTSTGYYRAALATLGQPASILPMFGNVPRTPAAGERVSWPGVAADALVCGHFGTMHPGWRADDFFAEFAVLAAARGRPAAFVAAGSLGYGTAWFEQMAARWKGSVACVALGRLGATELSRAFSRFDFAATSVPWNILGKSGSAAALREHGLRVVVTAAGSAPRFAAAGADDAEDDAGWVRYFSERALLATADTKTAPRPGIARTAARFLSDLHETA